MSDLIFGQKVLIKSLKKQGIFHKMITAKLALINMGKLELKIDLTDLEVILPTQNERPKVTKKIKSSASSAKSKSIKIDYHGFTKESCLSDFELKLNQAYLDNVKEIIVVHGRGQGILKQALINYLKNINLKLSFRSGAVNENELIINL